MAGCTDLQPFLPTSLAQARPAERAGVVTELKGEGFAELQNQRRPLEQSAALLRDTVGSNFAGGLLIELDGLYRLAKAAIQENFPDLGSMRDCRRVVDRLPVRHATLLRLVSQNGDGNCNAIVRKRGTLSPSPHLLVTVSVRQSAGQVAKTAPSFPSATASNRGVDPRTSCSALRSPRCSFPTASGGADHQPQHGRSEMPWAIRRGKTPCERQRPSPLAFH